MSKLAQRELRDVAEQLSKAIRKRGGRRMASTHEGWAMVMEEVDELWDEVKRKQDKQRPKRMRKEAIQIAVAAVWFAMEVMRNGDDSGH